MFLTITIDTHQKRKSKVRMNKKRMNAAKGWRQQLHFKKRGLFQKVKQWRKSLSPSQYKPGEQKVMF